MVAVTFVVVVCLDMCATQKPQVSTYMAPGDGKALSAPPASPGSLIIKKRQTERTQTQVERNLFYRQARPAEYPYPGPRLCVPHLITGCATRCVLHRFDTHSRTRARTLTTQHAITHTHTYTATYTCELADTHTVRDLTAWH